MVSGCPLLRPMRPGEADPQRPAHVPWASLTGPLHTPKRSSCLHGTLSHLSLVRKARRALQTGTSESRMGGNREGPMKEWLVPSALCLLHPTPHYGMETSELGLAPRQPGARKPSHLTPPALRPSFLLSSHFCLSVRMPSLAPHVPILTHLIHTRLCAALGQVRKLRSQTQ